MKELIKKYAEIVSEKNKELSERISQERLEERTKQARAFNLFKDQVRIDMLLSTICSLLDKNHTSVTVYTMGRFIVPDDRYKGDTRLVYRNEIPKYPVEELIQKDDVHNVGTISIPGDDEITFVITNDEITKTYQTSVSYKNLGIVLQHRYDDEWETSTQNDDDDEWETHNSYEWTAAVLKQVKSKETFISFLTEVLNEINLDFEVINSKITSLSDLTLPLFRISLRGIEEKV